MFRATVQKIPMYREQIKKIKNEKVVVGGTDRAPGKRVVGYLWCQ